MEEYPSTSSNCDIWKSTNVIHLSQEVPRSSSCMDWNTGYPSIEYESLPNIFTLTSYSPSYKDLSVLKEKPPDAVADVLLSLKNAVVRPSNTLPPIHPQCNPPPPQRTIINTTNNTSDSLGNMQHHQEPHYYNTQCHNPYQNPDHVSDHGTTDAALQRSHTHTHTHSHSHTQHFQPNNTVYHHHRHHPHHHQASMSIAPPQDTQLQYVPIQEHGMLDKGQQYSNFHGNMNYQESYNMDYCNMYRNNPTPPAIKHYNHDNDEDDQTHVYTMYNNQWKKHNKAEKRTYRTRCRSEYNKGSNLCRLCGKTYARPSTLKTHLRTHSGEKPYRCSTCDKAFSQAANLTAHVRTHSGEKPFKCMICHRSFSQSSSVTTHMRTHSGERPYKCALCKKAFADSSTLTKHLRIHSGEKPYQCKLCMLRFSQSGNLNRHMRVHSSL
ncbi:uncharacterized protein LOC100329028 [Saccoglossus kowalevskii]